MSGFQARDPCCSCTQNVLEWSGRHPEERERAINNGEHIRAYGPYYLSGQFCGDNVTGTG